MKNFRLGHLTRNNLRSLRAFFAYMQETLPTVIEKIHIFNTFPSFNLVMKLISPLMKADIIKKVKLLKFLQLNSNKSFAKIRCTCTHHRLTFKRFMRNMCRDHIYHLMPSTMVFVVWLKSYINNTTKNCWKCASISSMKKRLGIKSINRVVAACITRDIFFINKIKK